MCLSCCSHSDPAEDPTSTPSRATAAAAPAPTAVAPAATDADTAAEEEAVLVLLFYVEVGSPPGQEQAKAAGLPPAAAATDCAGRGRPTGP